MASNQGENLPKLSKEIVNQLAVIIRTAQIHNPTNVAVLSSIEKFISLINSLLKDEGNITLEIVGDYFYVNESRVKFSMEYLLNFDFLVREFKKRSLGSVSFLCRLQPEDLQVFLKEFISSLFTSEPFQALQDGMKKVSCFDVGPLRKVKEDAEEQDIRKTVKKTYFNAVSFTKGVMNKLRSGEKISMKKAKRVVESMVDTLLEQEEFLIGMTAIKDYDEYTYHHSVNVNILSIAIGQRLGLGKKSLMELGLVALFHDIGKMEVPQEVLNKPTSFTDEEWKIIKKHPVWGVRAVLRMKGFDASSIRAAIVAFEHHIHHDRTGYPQIMKTADLDLYSRIVSIADQYDGMTSSRVYSRVPMTPEKALSLMMERMERQLDPLLFKFFINLVGVYPIGTLVMLNTRELGLVYGSNAMFPTQPRVMVITDEKGNRVDGRVIDLTEKDAEGRPLKSIIRTLNPNKYNINLAEYML
jgi:putative nucleotidyltransferase with HDIG domain